jgi:pimeloyl-ACP methyl ester carboxylesterase
MTDFPKAEMIDCGEVELEVYQAGKGGIPVVLAHGWPEHAYSWRYQIPALVEQGYHVIVPNQRGYGGSGHAEEVEGYDCHHLTSDYNGLLDALNIDKAVFIGHDWGAILVWYHAMLNPERVVGVANLSVPLRPREEADPVAFWEELLGDDFYIVHFNRQPGVAATAFEANPRQFLKNMYRTKQWLDSETREPRGTSIVEMADLVLEHGEPLMSDQDLDVFVKGFERSGFHGPCSWYRNFTRNWEITESLEQKVVAPSLMIYGKHDIVPESDMTGYVDDLEVHQLDCGHWIQQEKPVETNEILIEWLNRRMKPLFAG